MKHSRRLRLMCLEQRAVPAIATWDGGGADANWTTPANWAGDVAPIAGDDLIFPPGAQRLSNVNDFLAGTVFGSITVTKLNYALSGNSISLTGGFTANLFAGPPADTDLQVSFGLMLTGMPLTISVNSRSLVLSGPVTGSGGLVKEGGGLLAISGANNYSGPTTVAAGILQVRSNMALGAIGAGDETFVQDGANLALSGVDLAVAEPISFSGQGIDLGKNLQGLELFTGAISNASGFNAFSGPLTLVGDATIGGATVQNSRLTISSGIGESGGPHDLLLNVGGLGVTFPAGAVNTFTGRTTVNFNAVFDGQAKGPTDVVGSLSGVGTLGPVHAFGNSSVRPGLAGLTVGDLTLDSGMFVTFGPAGNSHYVVHGTTKVGGLLQAAPTETQVHLGDVLTIFNNDGTDPVLGTFDGLPEGAAIGSTSPHLRLRVSYVGGDGNDVTLTAYHPLGFAAGAGPGGEPRVNVYDADGALMRTFLAFPAAFRGGVRVATGDVTGDHLRDVITAAGPGGGPLVRAWDGVTGALVREFYAYDQNFAGGVFIDAVDVLADGRADIITGAGPGGGPHVKVFSGFNGAVGADFFAYDANFRGGVSVTGTPGASAGHIQFNGQIITGAGPGGGPHVRTFDTQGHVKSEFFAFDPSFHGGVSVTLSVTGQLQGLDQAGLIVAPMSDGVPVVQINDFNGKPSTSFFAYDPAFRGGVNLAVVPIGLNGAGVILTGAGPSGGSHLREWAFAEGPVVLRDFFAFEPSFNGGVFVG